MQQDQQYLPNIGYCNALPANSHCIACTCATGSHCLYLGTGITYTRDTGLHNCDITYVCDSESHMFMIEGHIVYLWHQIELWYFTYLSPRINKFQTSPISVNNNPYIWDTRLHIFGTSRIGLNIFGTEDCTDVIQSHFMKENCMYMLQNWQYLPKIKYSNAHGMSMKHHDTSGVLLNDNKLINFASCNNHRNTCFNHLVCESFVGTVVIC